MSIWRVSMSWPLTPREAAGHLGAVQARLDAAINDTRVPEERIRDLTLLRDAWREHVDRLYATAR